MARVAAWAKAQAPPGRCPAAGAPAARSAGGSQAPRGLLEVGGGGWGLATRQDHAPRAPRAVGLARRAGRGRRGASASNSAFEPGVLNTGRMGVAEAPDANWGARGRLGSCTVRHDMDRLAVSLWNSIGLQFSCWALHHNRTLAQAATNPSPSTPGSRRHELARCSRLCALPRAVQPRGAPAMAYQPPRPPAALRSGQRRPGRRGGGGGGGARAAVQQLAH